MRITTHTRMNTRAANWGAITVRGITGPPAEARRGRRPDVCAGGRRGGFRGDVDDDDAPEGYYLVITWLLPMESHTPGALVTQSLMVTGARAVFY